MLGIFLGFNFAVLADRAGDFLQKTLDFLMKFYKKAKKLLAVGGLALFTTMAATPFISVANAGILADSAGKNAIDGSESDIKEIGGATILVSAIIWGIKATRRIAG